MKKEALNHPLTPVALRKINDEITVQLAPSSDLDLPELNRILAERDDIVKAHLETLSDEDKRAFARAEIPVNDKLKELAQSLLQSAKDDVSKFIQSQAAVKKYK